MSSANAVFLLTDTILCLYTAPPSDTLKVVTVNVYTEQECEDIYNANVPLGTQLTSINICAGLLEGGRDACFVSFADSIVHILILVAVSLGQFPITNYHSMLSVISCFKALCTDSMHSS